MQGHHGPVIDACAFHEWSSPLDLAPYMSEGWERAVRRAGEIRGPMNVKGQWIMEHPHGGKSAQAGTEAGPAGTDPATLIREVLDDRGVDRVVLGHFDGLLSSAYPLPYLARQLVRAINDWTVDRWLSQDDRLHGQVLISSALPEDAAAEIRRVGVDERMVAVAMGANGLGRPFGHPAYHPIFEAAAELELPIVMQTGADAIADLNTSPTSAGLPATFGELHALAAQPLLAHMTSLLTGGVFDLFPQTRIVLLGGGVGWVPGYLWRTDYQFKLGARRVEMPWTTVLPSEYFPRHVRLGTYSLESPREPERLAQLLEAIPNGDELLMFAGGYPNWDGEAPDAIAARVPAAWHQKVFHDNAAAWFRWPRTTSSGTTRPAIARREIVDYDASPIT
jgi:predicted TIM-barrel fold metal-dependent hydrolase